jgi:hypothetical protein
MEKTQAITDVPTLRRQAREHTGDGAVTSSAAMRSTGKAVRCWK